MSAQFSSLEELCSKLQGTRPIKKLLVANNGLAALKGIRSIRDWLYDHLSDSDAIQFAVMATPEDMEVNAEFIRMSDQHVEVPGGSNANNYANVDLIVSTAIQLGCDAVYPGWGHASENPALPRECEKSRKVTFLGPPEGPMFALGDKIASTIIAQSNGVPTVPWSGDHLKLPEGTFHIDPAVYDQAYVTTAEQCVEVCKRIGFPVMIKASEGGGGKGIRRTTSIDQVADMFHAVKEEVKGCHIFVMRMLSNVRHLEVQLLADKYGNCIAVRTRDCSVQRRHQKIIEEGPVVGVDPATVLEMENAAIRLAHAVGYVGLGTVEYMYDKETGKFSFLELNPRIQVEHPVSELISGVNLPAALLCVGMGIPLYRIPEIRAYYGEHLYGDSVIDFKTRMAQPPRCHAIAVRVTAEDVDEGFRPTTGHIDEISFRNSRDCWGYFSVSSGGGVHQFADSQFGHIFSTGETREDARRGMVIALRNITVRGEIRTSSAYVRELLEMQEFRECDVSTSWLDGLIANRSRAIKEQDMWPALIAAAITRMKRHEENNAEKYAQFLRAGHVPSIDYLSDVLTETFVLHTNKYVLEIGKINPSEYAISLNGSVAIVPCREFSSGALQMTLGGRTVVAYGEEEPASLRITINGKSTSFTGDVDPTKLRSSVPGRLVRFVVPDGGHVDENCAYAEVEVMKMILQLKSAVSGTVHLRATAGCTVTIGKLLAEVDPDDPSKVTRPTEVTDTWPDYIANPPQPTTSGIARVDGVTRARAALDSLWNMVLGYSFEQCSVQERINDAIDGLPSLCLSSVSIRSLNRAFFEPADFDASTPNDKMHAVYRCIINKYLETERWFDGCTREEAIDKLRERFGEDTATVRAIDFAHHKQHRHEVVRRLLVELEQNRTLMTSCKDILKELSELQSSHYYGAVLLQARYLQRQTSMPSFDQRKAQLAAKLEEGQIESIINMSFGFDLMCAVMFDPRSPHLAQLSLELFVRRSYFGVATLTSVDIFKKAGTWTGMWRFDTAELDDALTVTEDASVAAAAAPRSPFGGDLPANGWGFAALYFDEQEMTQNFGNLLSMVTTEAEAESVATIFVSLRADLQQNELARRCHEVLHANLKALTTSLLQTVTFIVHGAPNGPSIFTFTRRRDFAEDSIQRNLIPTTASRLELHMLSKYSLEMFSTPHRSVHIFTAVPRDVGRAVLPMEHRMFVRMYVSPGDLGVEPWTVLTELECSRVLSTFIAATEFARADKKLAVMVYNHLFINLIELTMNVAEVGATMRKLASSYAKKLFSLGFREVELKFRAVTPEGTVPFRVFITNHTGYSLQISSFVEAYEAGKIYLQPAQTTDDIADEEQLLASPSVAKSGIGCRHFSVDQSMDELASAADTPDSSHLRSPNAKPALRRNMSIKKLQSLKKLLPSRDSQSESPAAAGGAAAGGTSLFTGAIALEPYPATSARQLKRLQAQAIPTTYVHDWAIVFEVALRGQWKELAAGRGLPQSAIPSRPVEFVQLTLNDAQTALEEGEPTGRKISGMLVWRCDYFPPTYFDLARGEPESRSVIIVANDITFQSGSFSVAEDVVFKAACDMAQEKGLPFVYLSANSGARLGLSAEVKKYFKAALRADTFDYIYLTPEDLSTLSSKGVVVNTEKVVVEGTGEVRHKIIDIIGENGDYLGVENLQGSALIAGLMSQNYATIPTISVATGRTVGIGAYLVRLGRRVVQCKNAPIILTGASALNRLLGKEVYTGNNQLGGNAIMQPNGVTHWEAKDDLAAVQQVLNWLNFVPAVTDMRKCVPRVLTLPQVDPIDRDVTFFPARDELYDPRQLVAGNGTLTGMFDKGSFNESLKDWAKTVAVGRATLGGIPCGVILVETRITKKFDPADPADPQSTSSFVSQAGQVWFPDSARKTADALEDFHHERLPCFIFANWRGFSGGMRDMFDEVIKFGASIVDNLRVYTAPVFIYIPPFGELRGGAWVVVDPVINHQGVVEMYCDKTARGGILEPAGVVEIKFREAELRQVMLRNHPELAELHKTDPHEARKREAQLLPLYNDIAIHFADLHDTPGRMKAKGCIVDVIPWAESRRRFHAKLQRKLREVQLAGTIVESGVAPALDGALRMLKQWCLEAHRGDAAVWGDDAQALQWMHEQVGTIKKRVASFHNAVVAERLAKEFEAASGEGAAQLLASKLVSALSPALREALKREIDEKNREENL